MTKIKVVRKHQIYPVIRFSYRILESLYQASIGEYSVEEPKERLYNTKKNLQKFDSTYLLEDIRYKSPNPKIIVPFAFEKMEKSLSSKQQSFNMFEAVTSILRYVTMCSSSSLITLKKCVRMTGFDPELQVYYPNEMGGCYLTCYYLDTKTANSCRVSPRNNSQYLIFKSITEDVKVFLGIGCFKDLFVFDKRQFALLEDTDKEMLEKSFRNYC